MRILKLESKEKEILTQVLENTQSGVTVREIRQALKIIDQLAKEEDEMALDDANYIFLMEKFTSTKFAVVSRELVALADKLEQAVEA